jgi:hypothetical protein
MFFGHSLPKMPLPEVTPNVESQDTTRQVARSGGQTPLQTALQDPLQHAAADLATAAKSAANIAANAMDMLRGTHGSHKTVDPPVQSAEAAERRPRPSAPDYAPKQAGKSGSAVSGGNSDSKIAGKRR